ncbi:MAG: hypothetical protein ACKVW3_09135 [Phycisphaerales bacterium]
MTTDPDMLVPLTSARTEFEVSVIVEALRAAGIQAQAFAHASAALQLDAAMAPSALVMVRRGDLAAAAEALSRCRNDATRIEREQLEALACGSHEADEWTSCLRCGYDLAGLPPSSSGVRCPECGGEWSPQEVEMQRPPSRRRQHGVAIVATAIAAGAVATTIFGWAISPIPAAIGNYGPADVLWGMFSVVPPIALAFVVGVLVWRRWKSP